VKLYGLTNKGLAISQNYRNSTDDPPFKIIAYLYRTDRATIDNIASGCGMTPREAAKVIRFKLNGIVAEE
jgi:hypothetical protein